MEVLQRTLDHALRREDFCLADRGRRFDIDDDRVISIDQVVDRIGEEGWSAMRRGPPCCRIGWRDELGRHFACRPECRIVEDGEILLDRTAGRIRWQTRGTIDAIAVAGVDGRSEEHTSELQSRFDLVCRLLLEKKKKKKLRKYNENTRKIKV